MRKYVLNMQLQDTDISRKISVLENTKFDELHDIIQIIFGWDNCHLHCFNAGKMTICGYENYEDEDDLPANFHEESGMPIDMIFLNFKKISYDYDYGDGWTVDIKVDRIEETNVYEPPKVLNFTGKIVVDDCGGPIGLKDIETEDVDIEELNSILNEIFN